MQACPELQTPTLRPPQECWERQSSLETLIFFPILQLYHSNIALIPPPSGQNWQLHFLKIALIQHKYYSCSRGDNNDSIYLSASSTTSRIIIIIPPTQLVLYVHWEVQCKSKCLDSEQSSVYLLHIYRYLTFICIYINRQCACYPYKCHLYTSSMHCNCTNL